MQLRRGTLRAFDAGAYTAEVQFDGSRHANLTVPVSRGIAAAEMLLGRTVAAVEFWPGDPNATVVVGIW